MNFSHSLLFPGATWPLQPPVSGHYHVLLPDHYAWQMLRVAKKQSFEVVMPLTLYNLRTVCVSRNEHDHDALLVWNCFSGRDDAVFVTYFFFPLHIFDVPRISSLYLVQDSWSLNVFFPESKFILEPWQCNRNDWKGQGWHGSDVLFSTNFVLSDFSEQCCFFSSKTKNQCDGNQSNLIRQFWTQKNEPSIRLVVNGNGDLRRGQSRSSDNCCT